MSRSNGGKIHRIENTVLDIPASANVHTGIQESFGRMSKRVLIPYRHAKKVKAYEDAARAGGAEPFARPVTEPLSLDGMSGLLLMGGTDVNPKRYGATPRPETDQPDDERDAIELELIREAIEKDVPILAICRGLQLLNVYHGGTLIQHLGLERHDPNTDDKSAAAHEIQIEPGTELEKIAGNTRWAVNSRHHQAVEKVGGSLVVSARDLEGDIVEALERRDRSFVLAVQWHPEDQLVRDSAQIELFRCFAEACDRRV